MSSFSKSSHKSRQKIKLKIQTISGDILDVEVFYDENLGTLIRDFFEFNDIENDIQQIRISLFDPETPSRNKKLNLDESFDAAGVKDGDRLVIMTDDDLISEDDTPIAALVSKEILQLRIPFREKMTVGQYLRYSNDLLFSLDFLYSIFLISHTDNEKIINVLQEMLMYEEKKIQQEYLQEYLYKILTENNTEKLRITKIQYGSPLTLNFEGIWEPLKLIVEVIKDIKWRAKHEEDMANLSKQKMQIEIADKYLDVILKASKLKLTTADHEKLLTALVPNVSRLDSVLSSSNMDPKRKKLQSTAKKT